MMTMMTTCLLVSCEADASFWRYELWKNGPVALPAAFAQFEERERSPLLTRFVSLFTATLFEHIFIKDNRVEYAPRETDATVMQASFLFIF